jgi:hypothetical protein
VFTRVRRRGVLAVLSDFLEVTPAFWQAVDLFRRSRFDVMLFHIVHPEELDLPAVIAARFVETEGGQGRFDAEPDAIRALYRDRIQRHIDEIGGNCRARGCDRYLARTSENPYDLLRRCFLEREARK